MDIMFKKKKMDETSPDNLPLTIKGKQIFFFKKNPFF